MLHVTREEERIRRAIRESTHPEREAELDLALHTGMRWGEQYSLRWQDVDFFRNVITIPKPKGGKTRHVQLNADAVGALKKLRALTSTGELVCPRTTYDQHHDWWQAVISAAGISDAAGGQPPLRWHDLRHTFASRLVMNGVDIYTVSKLMGHKSTQVTQRYAHLGDQHLAGAVAKLGSVTVGVTAAETTYTRKSYVQ